MKRQLDIIEFDPMATQTMGNKTLTSQSQRVFRPEGLAVWAPRYSLVQLEQVEIGVQAQLERPAPIQLFAVATDLKAVMRMLSEGSRENLAITLKAAARYPGHIGLETVEIATVVNLHFSGPVDFAVMFGTSVGP